MEATHTTVAIGTGVATGFLPDDTIRTIVRDGLRSLDLDGKRVLFLIPDGTRTMPMPMMFRLFQEELGSRVAALDYLVALGTHPPMDDAHLSRLVGQTVVDGKVGRTTIHNHHWEKPETFATLGVITRAETQDLTRGKLVRDVTVTVNRLVFDYDQLIVCGPVFPHEVVGFSGGSKYFFPGIGGPEIINFSHWLGALLTCYDVIGSGYTPVRAVIDRAVSLIDRPISCLGLVVTHDGIAGAYFGSLQAAWESASALSSQRHITWVDRPYRRALAVMPDLYDDLWTAAKGMYKLEPAIAEGGEVVIYAPHITEVSYTHGRLIDEVGYHCLDYFLKQWDRFAEYPGGVLAHSTHVKGLGRYDAATGVETPRITVTLATGIPEERCRRINLGYCNPASIRMDEWKGREAEDILLVPRAGEMLYRVNPQRRP
jgi:nickel-dependent lactate racemase